MTVIDFKRGAFIPSNAWKNEGISREQHLALEGPDWKWRPVWPAERRSERYDHRSGAEVRGGTYTTSSTLAIGAWEAYAPMFPNRDVVARWGGWTMRSNRRDRA